MDQPTITIATPGNEFRARDDRRAKRQRLGGRIAICGFVITLVSMTVGACTPLQYVIWGGTYRLRTVYVRGYVWSKEGVSMPRIVSNTTITRREVPDDKLPLALSPISYGLAVIAISVVLLAGPAWDVCLCGILIGAGLIGFGVGFGWWTCRHKYN